MASEVDDWMGVVEAFSALEPLSPADRTARLRQVPDTLRARVEEMLAAAEREGILDRPSPELGEEAEPLTASLAAGERVGAFVIDDLLAIGGMGEVFRAHRADAEFEQQVALKLMRADAVPSTALFARERQLLARLDHPGIARLIDGGVTPGGRPWMAMDYIDGQPVDVWCAAAKPSLDQRLTLFGAICEAVQYAHANLVVHRDLKPSNILIDAAGRPHLVDFGIAKLLDESNAGAATTRTLLTPEYAAPEQLEDGAITVATDVYGLGVVLFQMLTGATPWREGGGNLPSVVRRILQDDPPLASRSVAAGGAGVAAADLRGDIDAIVAKALRKDPGQRYASVADFAADLARHRTARPVLARQGSRRYRYGRFLRRNRLAVAATALIVLAIVAGAVGIAIQAHRATVERDRALAEARRSDSIVQTLTLLFGQSAGSSDLTLKQAMDQSMLRLLATLDASERSGDAVNALSDIYVNMQDPKGSMALLEGALERGIGADSPAAVARMRTHLADDRIALGKVDEAIPLLDSAEAVFKTDPERYAADTADLIGVRAAIARRKGDYDGAINLLTSTLPEAEHAWAENSSALLTRYNNLLVYLLESNRLDPVAGVLGRVDRIMRTPGAHDLIQAIGIDQLRAAWLLRTGHPADAERQAVQVVEHRRRLFGDTAGLANDLALVAKAQIAQGKFVEAEAALKEAQPITLRLLGPGALSSQTLNLSLAQVQAERGDAAAAHATLAQAEKDIAALPQAKLLAGPLAMTQAIVALKAGDLTGARAAIARSRQAFTAMGPPGAFGLTGVAVVEKRIAAVGR